METRLADDSIGLLLCFLCPGNGTLISGIPTTILIGWGLSWCSLSFLYGLLKSSLNGVSLDSATCSIFSGSSSSPVFQGNAFRWNSVFKRALIHIVAILFGALYHRLKGRFCQRGIPVIYIPQSSKLHVTFFGRTTGLYTKTLAKIIYRDITRFSVVFLIVFIGFCGAMFMALKATDKQDLFT